MTPLQLLGLEAAKGTYKGAKKAVIRYETVILAIIAFYGVRYLKQQSEAKKYKEAGAGTSEAADYARRIYDALHPYADFSFSLPFFGYFDIEDGTDEAKIKIIASEIGQKKIGQEVSAAYKAIYGRSMEEQLVSDGVFDIYTSSYNSGSTGKGSGSTGTGSGGSGSSKDKYIGWVSSTPDKKTKSGDFVYSYDDRNLRDIFKPEKVVNKTVVGEKYKVLKMKFTNIGGTLGWWLWVEETTRKYTNGFILQEYIIYSGSTYKK